MNRMMRAWAEIPGFEWTQDYPFSGSARYESWEVFPNSRSGAGWRHFFTGTIVPIPVSQFEEEGHWFDVAADTNARLPFVTYALMSERVITYRGDKGPHFRKPNIKSPSWRLITCEGTHSYPDKWGNIRQPFIRHAAPEFFVRVAS